MYSHVAMISVNGTSEVKDRFLRPRKLKVMGKGKDRRRSV